MTGSRLDTNFDVSPWYDDFNEADANNYYRILFKPSIAVQARELTQIQSILQEQIAKFGSYVFKDGSIVDRCALTYIPNYPVIYVSNEFNSNTDLSILDIPSNYLLVSNSGVRAAVSTTRSGFELTYPETNRFYVNYISTGTDGSGNDIAEFQSGETLYVYNSSQSKFGTLVANNLIDSIDIITSNGTANATGTAYGISVSDGIIFQKGFFVSVNEHTIPVRDHDTSVNNYVVGFNTAENIINAAEDENLYSNAAGFNNFNAPGADRLQLISTLVSKPKSDTANSTNFFAIVEFDSSNPTQTNTDESSLNTIRDILATRTYEESGNYTIKPFTIDTAASANSQQFQYNISTGIMYVNGYRIEKTNAFNLVTDRATTLREATQQIATANYGNYVLVNEHVGTFDFDHAGTVNIYNTSQHAVSTYTNSSAGNSGTLIGTASIVDFQYDSGTKGTPNCLYRMYLTNVRMSAGYSFAQNAKSIVSAANVGAKADIVLDGSGYATFQDAASQTLVFPIGPSAIYTLRNAQGGNETSFVFRDTTSATMAANGVVTFTTNVPANGGLERLNASVGVLSNSLASNFNITTGAAAYSANLSGTISYTNTVNTVTGTGTTFNTNFKVGDMVRVNTTGAAYVIRAITGITNSTFMQLDSPIAAAANTASKIQKYYPQGHVVNLADFSGSITVLSNTQFTVDTNLDAGVGTVDSGTMTLYAEYPVLRTNAVAIKKNINKHRFVQIDCSNNVAGAVGPWDLGFVDIAKVRNVYIGTTFANTNPERSSWFTYDNGQKDAIYDHGKLIVSSAYKSNITTSTKMLVELDHYTANTAQGVGFYSVDSYPIDDANTSNVNAIQTAEIPRYFSSNYNEFIDLRNSVDFRPRYFNTANSATSIAGATTNPAAANGTFDSPATGEYMIDADTNFTTDLQYYLPRKDLIVINTAGAITARLGQPNELPVYPTNEIDTAIIAQVTVPPYPSLSTPEAITYNRDDLKVGVDVVTSRVYTQPDIGTLDTRITRLEYYTTLNLLEQQAANTSITDSNGLDRFKNGIFAEPFSNFNNSKTNDIEFAIAIDEDLGVARPKFNQHNIDYNYRADLSSSVAKTGNFITAPYTHELFVDQRYSTGTRNATGAVWQWNGKLNLYPTYDYATDEIDSGATLNVTQDLTSNVATGTTYGDWRTVASSTSSSTTKNGNATTTTNTTTTTSEQVITTTSATTLANTVTTGKYVVSVSENAYIRSREVAFIATGMKPNTTMHMFFDNVLVDQYCAPGVASGINDVESGSEQLVVNRTGNYGTTVKSDANGNVWGMFKIPANTFLNGSREFVVANVDDLVNDSGSILTEATSYYTASSISVTTGTTTLTTLTTQVSTSTTTASRTSTVTTSNTVVTANTSNTVATRSNTGIFGRGGSDDPIAQSFTATVPSNVSGCFLTKVGMYFETKDPTLGVTVQILQTSLGIPDSSKVYGTAYLKPSDINISSDSSVETQFVFQNPVYLENGKEYAFMVKPDGNSPEYNMFVAATGSYDILTGEQVYSNPYSGNLFVSSNALTWTANQTEDLKFRLYRANFSLGGGRAVFTSTDDDFLTITGLVKSNTNIDVDVGDYVVRAYANGLIQSNTSNADYYYGSVKEIDEASDYIRVTNSAGTLGTNEVIQFHRSANSNVVSFNANTLIATTNVSSVDDMAYNAAVPRFAAISPALTSLVYSYKGYSNTYLSDTSSVTVTPETETEFFDYERIVASKSNENSHTGGDKTSTYTITLSTSNIYVSPVIDLRRKASLMIENVINNDTTNEYTRYGNATTKYISKNIVLSDDVGDAEDNIAYLGAYRPVGADIQVYIKILGSEDGESFDSKLWTQMVMDSGSQKLYSATANTSDYHEYVFNMPSSIEATVGSQTTAYLNANTGIVQYARSDGALISRYKTYCYKIVLISSDSSNVPRLTDFRSIAVQA